MVEILQNVANLIILIDNDNDFIPMLSLDTDDIEEQEILIKF